MIRSMIEMHAAGCEGGQEAPVDCPLCGMVFPAQRIEQHASTCMAWFVQFQIQWKSGEKSNQTLALTLPSLRKGLSCPTDQAACFYVQLCMAWLIILMHPVKNSCLALSSCGRDVPAQIIYVNGLMKWKDPNELIGRVNIFFSCQTDWRVRW